MPETPEPNGFADALDEVAESMREFPNQPTTPEEVALIRRVATVVRRLTADNARLRHDLEAALDAGGRLVGGEAARNGFVTTSGDDRAAFRAVAGIEGGL